LRGEIASEQSDFSDKRVSHDCDPFKDATRALSQKPPRSTHGARMTLRHVNTSQEKITRIHTRMLKTLQATAQHSLSTKLEQKRKRLPVAGHQLVRGSGFHVDQFQFRRLRRLL
jgi:hypothetical protein